MEPDPRIRRALRALADEDPELGRVSTERIAREVAERGPAEVARGRNAILAKRSAVVLFAAAAAVVLGTLATREEAPRVVSHERLPETSPVAPACATRAVETTAGFVAAAQGGTVLDLGTRAVVRASAGTTVEVGALEPCELVIALHEGSVSIEARDLGGGTLAVRTPEARVTVRGTRFDVHRRGDATDVTVREGVVVVAAASSTIELRAGERARASGGTITRSEDTESADGTAADPGEQAARPSSDVASADTEHAVRPAAHARDALDAEALATRGAARERAGDLAGARADYRAAMTMSGLAAEAACLSLARLELRAGRAAAARSTLRTHRARFAGGSLAVEAAWLAVQVERTAGRSDEARALAEQLVRDHAGTAQARAAQAWLSSGNDREDER